MGSYRHFLKIYGKMDGIGGNGRKYEIYIKSQKTRKHGKYGGKTRMAEFR